LQVHGAAMTSPSLRIMIAFALCGGLLASNMYYFQPLSPFIAREMGWSLQQATSLTPVAQAGYGLGLLFLVPLADRMDSRQLILRMMGVSVIALLLLFLLQSWVALLLVTFILGISLSALQILLPVVSGLVSSERRGHALGILVAGTMVTIALARPFASLMGSFGSWQLVFAASAVLIGIGTCILYRMLPSAPRSSALAFGPFMREQIQLWRDHRILRQRALTQSVLFAAFSAYWTALPPLLVSDAIGLSQLQLSLFSLVAITAALTAPLAGFMSDRQWLRQATWLSLLVVLVAFLIAALAMSNDTDVAVVCLLIAAGLLDVGVTLHLVIGQRQVVEAAPNSRSRLNSLYIATFFAWGAFGSWAGGQLYATVGWAAVVTMLVLLACFGILMQVFWSRQDVHR